MILSGVSWSDRGFHLVDVDLLEEKSPGGHRLAQGGQQVWTLKRKIPRKRTFKSQVVFYRSFWFLSCCRAIGHIMTTLFYPVITFLLLTVCISYWAVTAVYPSDGSPVTTEKHIYILYVLQSSELRQSHAHCKVSVCETLQYPENRKLIFFSLTST